MAGHEGYLFIADGSNRWETQFSHERPAPEAWISSWRSLLAQRQINAARQETRLWNLIIPEKQVIYPEKRWPTGGPDGASRPVRQLLATITPEDRLIYPEQELLDCKSLAPVFSRRNSHWTASGAIAALEAVLRRALPGMALDDLAFSVERVITSHDLPVHFFDPAPLEPALTLVPAGVMTEDNRLYELTRRHVGSRYVLENARAPHPGHALIFGDSFAFDAGFSPALSSVFQKVTFTWSKDVQWDTVAAQRPALVLWESAERFILTHPSA